MPRARARHPRRVRHHSRNVRQLDEHARHASSLRRRGARRQDLRHRRSLRGRLLGHAPHHAGVHHLHRHVGHGPLARDWSFGHVRRRRRRQDLRGWRIRHRRLRVVRRRRAELRGDARRLRDDAELDVGPRASGEARRRDVRLLRRLGLRPRRVLRAQLERCPRFQGYRLRSRRFLRRVRVGGQVTDARRARR